MEGKCIILCAPSGAGKTSITKYLLTQDLGLEFSISACNREKRENEEDGVDYHFLTTEAFKNKIDNNEFVEWEEVYADNYYGTLKSEIARIWRKGHNVIFDVDVEGGLSLTKYFGEKALAIFIQPPSIEALEESHNIIDLVIGELDSFERRELELIRIDEARAPFIIFLLFSKMNI